ncbi:MFS transporter [Lysinibacillus sp. NPDC096418]|uniref:MFS transporter n=1 Tax=Lysinibacillus sp. NPDC096418 TaxID=3364138 RepID=UPI0038088D19
MNKDNLFSKSFFLLFVSNFFIFIGFEMIIPILPAHLASLGASTLQIGLVTSLFTLGAVIIRPFVGYYLINGQRKILALFASSALLIITLFYPIVSYVWIFLLFRFLHGLVWGVSTTTNSTLVVDVIPKNRLGEGMGYFSISTTVGAIIAPSMGILLYDAFSFDVLVWSAALLTLLAILSLKFVYTSAPAKRIRPPFQFGAMIFEKEIWFIALLGIITSFSFGSILTFLVLFGQEMDLDQIFLFFLVNAVVSTILRPFTGKWYDKNGPWSIIIISSFMGFLSLIILSYANNHILLIISAILFGAGYGTIMPCLQTWAVQKVSTEKVGSANGTFFSSFDIGVGSSALLLGFLANWFSLSMIYRLVSISFLIVAILVFYDFKKTDKSFR